MAQLGYFYRTINGGSLDAHVSNKITLIFQSDYEMTDFIKSGLKLSEAMLWLWGWVKLINIGWVGWG